MKKIICLFCVMAYLFFLSSCSNADTINQVEDSEYHSFSNNDTISSQYPESLSQDYETNDIQETDKQSLLEVYFLDVGEADAAILRLGKHCMLIDGGNRSDSSFIYSVLQNMSIDSLDYIVCSHPHDDHAGGLAGALNYCSVQNALASVTQSDSVAFSNFKKYLDVQNVPITIPHPGDIYSFGDAEIHVLGPIEENAAVNNLSLILKIIYHNTSFLFTGDAEMSEEYGVLSAGYDPKSDVLKVGHHGSNTSSSNEWLSAVNPSIAIISVAKSNQYDHPHKEVIDRLNSLNTSVLCTSQYGTILCISDGNNISVAVEHDIQEQTRSSLCEPEITMPQTEVDHSVTQDTIPTEDTNNASPLLTYVLNTSTKRFHSEFCKSISKIADKNKREIVTTRDEVLAMGYTPCGNCHP